MASKEAIGAFLKAVNKSLRFEKGFDNTVLLEQCERLSFSWRIHLYTEQCEVAAFSSTKTDRNENGAV